MPNICFSNIHITSEHENLAVAIAPLLNDQGKLESERLVRNVSQEPNSNAYDFNCTHLGTKWHFDSDDEMSLDSHYLNCSIETAWSMPDEFIQTLLYFLYKRTHDDTISIDINFQDEFTGQYFGERTYSIAFQDGELGIIINGFICDEVTVLDNTHNATETNEDGDEDEGSITELLSDLADMDCQEFTAWLVTDEAKRFAVEYQFFKDEWCEYHIEHSVLTDSVNTLIHS